METSAAVGSRNISFDSFSQDCYDGGAGSDAFVLRRPAPSQTSADPSLNSGISSRASTADSPNVESFPGSEPTQPKESYVYSAPLNSPFYTSVLSPFCDWLCHRFMPDCLTPNMISLIGLVSASLATFFAYIGMFTLTAPLWMLYCILDNMDGKQARRLKLSSPSGEFVDHAVDSAVTTLMTIVLTYALVPGRMQGWSAPAASVSCHIPFFLGCWAHHVLGRVLLGTKVTGQADWFTVDEMNLFVIPLVSLTRHFLPGLIDWEVFTLNSGHSPTPVTIGMLSVAAAVVISVLPAISIIIECYRPRVRRMLLPGLTFPAIVCCTNVTMALTLGPFSCLCMEIIWTRLHAFKRSSLFLWLPNMVLIGSAVAFPRGHPHHFHVAAILAFGAAASSLAYVHTLIPKKKLSS